MSSISAVVARRVPDRLLVGMIARAHRRFEPELRAIDALLPAPRRVALDVGAWYGPWTVALARRFGSVIAVEPNPSVAERLAGALPANARLERWAASDHDGTATLHAPSAVGAEGVGSLRPPDHTTGDGTPTGTTPTGTRPTGTTPTGTTPTGTTPTGLTTIEVPTRTIDSLGLDELDFVKLDVEGHELEALRGAVDTIGRCRPVVLVELEERLAPVRPVLDLMAGLGYRPHVVEGGRLQAIDTDDYLGLTPSPRSYLAAVVWPDASAPPHNVVFVPAEQRPASTG